MRCIEMQHFVRLCKDTAIFFNGQIISLPVGEICANGSFFVLKIRLMAGDFFQYFDGGITSSKMVRKRGRLVDEFLCGLKDFGHVGIC